MAPDLIGTFERLKTAADRASFALLDLRLSVTPIEDHPPTSWEVEREAFLRRLASEDDGS